MQLLIITTCMTQIMTGVHDVINPKILVVYYFDWILPQYPPENCRNKLYILINQHLKKWEHKRRRYYLIYIGKIYIISNVLQFLATMVILYNHRTSNLNGSIWLVILLILDMLVSILIVVDGTVNLHLSFQAYL